MRKTLVILTFFFSIFMYSQDNFNAEIFLENAMEHYATAQALEIEVTVNLYEKGSNNKENSFTCISRKNGNHTFLKIRNTDLITTDSLRLFVDHNNKYMQLQKINTNKIHADANNPADFVNQLKSNTKDFVKSTKVQKLNAYTIFTYVLDGENLETSYYFNTQTLLLEKIVNHYTDEESPYGKVEMIYRTNVNENKGDITINIEDFVIVKNKEIIPNEVYSDYEFINQLKDE